MGRMQDSMHETKNFDEQVRGMAQRVSIRKVFMKRQTSLSSVRMEAAAQVTRIDSGSRRCLCDIGYV